MRLAEGVSIALAALWANKLRSFLTLLGVIIGVSTVIAILTIIEGMNDYVLNKVMALGADSYFISKFGIIRSREEYIEAMKRKNLRMDDVEALRRTMATARYVEGIVQTHRRVKWREQYLDDVEVSGFSEYGIETTDLKIARGRHIIPDEALHRRPVVVIGDYVREKVFGNTDPLGQDLRVGGRSFTVIGVVEKRGSIIGQSMDNFVYVPITAFFSRFGQRRSVDIGVKRLRGVPEEQSVDEARLILRARRHVPYDEPDDFSIITQEALNDLWSSFSSGLFFVLIGVGSISLVVGGIVIMNIMLVSVTERTREIGIRKAIGARRRDVMVQFLLESATIAVIGGAMGVAIGFALALLIGAAAGLPAGVKLYSVALGLGVSGGVGIFFGIYPAAKAARLDPIEALRYE